MEFQKSVIELINTRKSHRTFEENDIDKKTYLKLADYIDQMNRELHAKVRFALIQNASDEKKVKRMGTYGTIQGANTFILGFMSKNDQDPVRFGYSFEKIILFATDLGLQTCWLGGTFNQRVFKQISTLHDDEYIPIVSPVGVKKDKPTFVDSTMRMVAGSNKRKPWNKLFYNESFHSPLDEYSAGLFAVPLEMVRLAPSASNKQPWRIIKDKTGFHFFLSRNLGYRLSGYDLQKNDIGIAMCHFELSAKSIGLDGSWVEQSHPEPKKHWEYIISWRL